MKLALINPPMVFQRADFFSSGIPYFPISLAYLASTLREKGHSLTVVDAFGEAPQRLRHRGNFGVQGLSPEEVLSRVPSDVDAVFIYCSLVTTHTSACEIAELSKARSPDVPVIFVENTQQVFAYSLTQMFPELLKFGDYVIIGESEERALWLLDALQGGVSLEHINGLAYKKEGQVRFQPKAGYLSPALLDNLPFPAFDLFPVEGYWSLGYSHGPYTGKYLPLLTSRGCPYACAYCVVPDTNERKWRFRSPKNVVDEMEHWGKAFGVTDFHWEDLNPTISKDRIVGICKEIIDRGLKVTWKLAAGTKVETFNEDTLEWMKKAGCVYVSISPESGEPRMLKLMNKPFDHAHGLRMIKKMDELGIFSQACFVLGFPGETDADLAATERYAKDLFKNGLDEAAFFIMTPIPGSSVYKSSPPNVERLEQLNFSPEWRPDYKKLHSFRTRLYLLVPFWKARFRPRKFAKNVVNLVTQKFDIKSEMTLWRMAKTHAIYAFAKKLPPSSGNAPAPTDAGH